MPASPGERTPSLSASFHTRLPAEKYGIVVVVEPVPTVPSEEVAVGSEVATMVGATREMTGTVTGQGMKPRSTVRLVRLSVNWSSPGPRSSSPIGSLVPGPSVITPVRTHTESGTASVVGFGNTMPLSSRSMSVFGSGSVGSGGSARLV